MFKNATLYRLAAPMSAPVHKTLNDCFEAHAFVPCGATQEKSTGWIPPRGHDNGALLESVAGQWILKLKTETKVLPADVLKRAVDEKAAQIEISTGRKPGKKERRELSDDIRLDLLPMAFTKVRTTLVWIDPAAQLLVIDSASQHCVDEVVTALIKSVDGLVLQLVNTQMAPASAMAQWLVDKEGPADFSIDRECELKASDESRAVVKYGRHPLDIDEVGDHIRLGKIPTRLALTWNDRVSFVLTDSLQLKKLEILDVVFEGERAESADAFDADVAIATGELRKLIPELIATLGGEVEAQPKVEATGTPAAHTGDGPDPMYSDAVAIVRTQKKASISLVQRHLQIGYNRAARLLESMEVAGLISPMKSSGKRDLLPALTQALGGEVAQEGGAE